MDTAQRLYARWQYAWLQTVQRHNSYLFEQIAHVFLGQPACLTCAKDRSCEGSREAQQRCKKWLKVSTPRTRKMLRGRQLPAFERTTNAGPGDCGVVA